MQWNDARLLDQLCYDAKLADYPRGLNRALIDALANGAPPYTEEEAQDNGIEVNVNFLEMTRLAHDSRSQFLQGFIKPGKFFSCVTDFGPKHKHTKHSTIVTTEINKMLNRSTAYYEALRGKFAQLVLHGIAPSVWENKYKWCPRIINLEDALLPSGTLVGFENLPYFIIYRSFTGMELERLTKCPKPDPGWNMPLVNKVLAWVDEQASQLMHSNWPEIWAPEKQQERLKSNSGFYASDQLPTIDTFDIYAYVDDGKESGWIRRIILDSWGQPSQSGATATMARRTGSAIDRPSKGDFLYTSRSRTVASRLSEIATFQFADLSAVAPFRYHSVRSLGFLIYSLCQLQNRMRCKFSEAVFEALMMYFRVKSADDVQRALKVNLASRGFIDPSVDFIPAADRFQVNAGLVELGLGENARLIQQHAGSFTPTADAKDRTEKTKFQVMSELNITNSLVTAALNQAYKYASFEYREIFRRACIRNSTDPDVQRFQAACVAKGLPLKMLNADLFEVEPERVMGSGNKTMELAIAQQLMEWRNLYDPEAQRKILRDSTTILTDDPARGEDYVPEQPHISDSIHDAQLAAGSLLQGLPVAIKSGINHTEYVDALLADIAVLIQQIQKRTQATGALDTTPKELAGIQNIIAHANAHVEIIAQDETEQERVKIYSDQLGKMANMLKGFSQQLAKQAEQSQQGQPGVDPETIGKIQAQQITAQAKAQNMRESHAQRTAQKSVQFEMEEQRKNQQTAAEIQRENARTLQELEAERLKLQQKKQAHESAGTK